MAKEWVGAEGAGEVHEGGNEKGERGQGQGKMEKEKERDEAHSSFLMN